MSLAGVVRPLRSGSGPHPRTSWRSRHMIRRFVWQWLQQMASSGHVGRRASRPNRRRALLRLEVLEGRCVPSTVTNLDDAGPGSLRQAIADTPTAGTVDFEEGLSGTITLTSTTLTIAKDLTSAGPGANALTVSGNHARPVFDIPGPFTVAISGLTIANGNGVATSGGIANGGGTLTITTCTLSGNSTSFSGQGGAIRNTGTLTVTSSTLSGNSASGQGGGIANVGGTLTITSSTVSDNSSSLEGGGIWNSGGNVTVTSSTLSGNSSSSQGGGIFSNNGNLTVTNSTLSGNSSSIHGGGILGLGGMLTLMSSTLSGNSVGGFGGGILHQVGGSAITNTILAGNTAGFAGPDLFGVLTSQGHNLIGDGSGGSGFTDTDLVGTDPLLGPLQDNGGPTFTHALPPGSLALDAGDNTDAPDFDQRGPGFPRIMGGQIDVGAFESQSRAAARRSVASPTRSHGNLTARDVSRQPAAGRSETTALRSTDAHPEITPDSAASRNQGASRLIQDNAFTPSMRMGQDRWCVDRFFAMLPAAIQAYLAEIDLGW